MNQLVATVLHMVNQDQEQFLDNIQLICKLVNDNTFMDYVALIVAHREEHQRNPGYIEEWLPRYIDYDFFSMFRMSRDCFNLLLRDIECEEIHKQFVGGNQPIHAEKLLLMTLWWLGKGETLLSVADKFDVCLSATHRSTELVSDLILKLLNNYIVWPSEEELNEIEVNFRDRAGFPGVIGAIDCCNIKFKAPSEQQNSYIDRKMQHSIKLQGIVTTNKIFTNIMVGFPGSAHDSRVFLNSGIFSGVTHEEEYRKYFPIDEYHIVGDSAYPLLKWVMKPYRDNGALNATQRNFNTKLSQTRVVVEHTFGLLKSRWRILNYVNVNSVEKAVNIITVCCILHNFCYINNNPWNEYVPLINNDIMENAYNANNEAINKRSRIAVQLMI